MKGCIMIDIKKILTSESRLVYKGKTSLPYLIYSCGYVFSVTRGRFLKPTVGKHGYYMLGNGLGSLHRLIASTFISDIPEGMAVNHIDGDKSNNDLSNLEIITYSENIRHAYKTGLMVGKSGETNSMAKISNSDYIEIARLLNDGYDNDYIGNKFNVHSRYISLIRHGKRWKEMYKEYGPFPDSFKNANDINYIKFNNYKSELDKYKNMTNREISVLFKVDPSTVSRWNYKINKDKCLTTIESTLISK